MSDKIRDLRISGKMTQGDFGKLFGVEQPTVSRWEGGATPDQPALSQLAKMAGEDVLTFLGKAGDAAGQYGQSVGPEHLLHDQLLLPVTLPSASLLAEAMKLILEAALEAPDLDERALRLAQSFPSALKAVLSRRGQQGDGTAKIGSARRRAGDEDPLSTT